MWVNVLEESDMHRIPSTSPTIKHSEEDDEDEAFFSDDEFDSDPEPGVITPANSNPPESTLSPESIQLQVERRELRRASKAVLSDGNISPALWNAIAFAIEKQVPRIEWNTKVGILKLNSS